MTQEPTPLVTVLPCDREAAASMFLYLRGEEKPNDVHADCIREGQSDDELVIAWARHRLAALEEAAKNERARYAALRSAQHALDIIARGSISAQGRRDLETLAREESNRIEQALTAIRSLSQPGDGSAHALARMVAMDEELEQQHPGWMTGVSEEQDERAWVAAELSKALVDRNEERFRTIAFWKRHVIIAALEQAAFNKGGRDGE